jgi:hypothetical protein
MSAVVQRGLLDDRSYWGAGVLRERKKYLIMDAEAGALSGSAIRH